MTFKQIELKGIGAETFMYGLDEEGIIWVVRINEWGLPKEDWKQFKKIEV